VRGEYDLGTACWVLLLRTLRGGRFTGVKEQRPASDQRKARKTWLVGSDYVRKVIKNFKGEKAVTWGITKMPQCGSKRGFSE